MAVSSLGSYPQLETYIADKLTAKDIELSSFQVSLGPNGSFYVRSNKGELWDGLDDKLVKELNQRLTPEGAYANDPLGVELGVDGSYVILGGKGDIMWDLKGQYGTLDEELQSAQSALAVSKGKPLSAQI